MGGDLRQQAQQELLNLFQSTPPVWGETAHGRVAGHAGQISIHSPRVGGDFFGAALHLVHGISIHSPRAGGDAFWQLKQQNRKDISIHSPRAGGDGQEIRPVHGQTYFNPLPPCGGRRRRDGKLRRYICISIHSPRAGGDLAVQRPLSGVQGFQSTPPVRGETDMSCSVFAPMLFQSTPPVRGETDVIRVHLVPLVISIHSPRAGGDSISNTTRRSCTNFNPLPPCGGRHLETDAGAAIKVISIHSPRAGGDLKAPTVGGLWSNFNPLPPCGGRPT